MKEIRIAERSVSALTKEELLALLGMGVSLTLRKDGEGRALSGQAAPREESAALDALVEGKSIRRKTWEKGQYARMNNRGDIVNQNGDCCYLPLIQCDMMLGASTSIQAQTLRSELCPKLWEEAK